MERLDAPNPGEPFGLYLTRRYWRWILLLAVGGFFIGTAASLLSPRRYQSSAIIVPESQDSQTSGLELAASNFGIRLPQAGNQWGTAVYVELLRSHRLLASIAADSVVVTEMAGRRIPVLDLLKAQSDDSEKRLAHGVQLLRQIVSAVEDKKLNAVRLSVTTTLPSLSYTIAQQLVDGVNAFNVQVRRSRATEERRFVDERVAEAENGAAASEERLNRFLTENRSFQNSAQLRQTHDRLSRDVALRHSVLSALLQKREDARIREVRDVPVITLLEEPRPAVTGLSRRTAAKAITGAIFGLIIAFGVVVFWEVLVSTNLEGREVPEILRALRIFRPFIPERWRH